MKKFILAILLLFMFVGNGFCALHTTSTSIREATSDDLEIAVGSTNTIYSKSMNIDNGYAFGLKYKATSDGTVSFTMDIEQCDRLPITEGVIDSEYQIPENVSTFDTVTDEDWHYKAFSPVATNYARIKFIGTGANDASTTVQLKFLKVENV